MRDRARAGATLALAAVAVALFVAPLPAASAGWQGHLSTPPVAQHAGPVPMAFDVPGATELFPNGSVSGTVVPGSSAVYKVWANRSDTAPEALSISLGTFGGLFYFGWVEVFDPYQVLVDQKVTRVDGQVNVSRFIVGETGYYLLVVSSTATYDWSLTVNLTAGAYFPTDNDNSLANATVLSGPGGSLVGDVTDWDDLYDTYRFDLQARNGSADALVVNLSGFGPADLDLYIYHIEGGVAVIDSYSITPFSLEFGGHYAGSTGPFYVRVLSYAGTAAYNLTWLVFDAVADANGRPEAAGPLPLGQSPNNLSRWDTADIFRIDAPANTTVNVTFHTLGWNATTRQPDLQAVLWDANFQRVTWSYLFDPDERIDAVLPTGGVYYLAVFPNNLTYLLATAMSFDYTMNASVDPPPVFVASAWDGSMVEDTPASFDLRAVVPPDPAAEPIRYEVTGVSGPVSAAVTGGSTLVVTPQPDAFGNATVSVRASDRWRSVDIDLPIVVAPVNDAPRLRPGSGVLSFDEDGTGVVDPNVTAVDPEGDAFVLLAAVASAPLNATLQGAAVVVSAPADFWGAGTVVLTVRDARGAQANLTLQVSVRPVNDAPRIVGSVGPFTIQEDAAAAGATFSLAGFAVDPDGDPITYSARGAPGIAVLVVNDTLTLVPARDFTGDATVTIDASDGRLNVSRDVAVHVLPVNDAPVVAPPANAPVAREGELFTFKAAASDVDTPPGDLRYSFWLDGTLVANDTADPTFSYNFSFDDSGFHVLRVQASDGELSTALDVSVFVSQTNRQPASVVLTPAGSVFAAGDVVLLTGRGTDPDGDPLTYRWIIDGSLAGQTESVSVSGLAPGPHTAVLFVSDGTQTVASEISFTVSQGSDAPGAALAAVAMATAAVVAWAAFRRRM